MPIRDWPTMKGKERERDARVTRSDIDDALMIAARTTTEQGRRMLSALLSEHGADGPVPDTKE